MVYGAFICGVRGIRTPDTLLAYTRFPGVPLQPLEHHSLSWFCECKGSFFLGITKKIC